ncbi:hypothetical protein AJ80_02591 [Polytolypa hystricis UAMH7299]|uniref:Peroxisomal membrane protein PEX14 n=1 Tax=Polytolypa hystricis (strain UAMH7299) TaxID=1447883 RepID=A0A2B7YR33_POLH7|nr:hypothetical protein AJ80_02591 [Polytolypa hystricis UAMH7299]
MAREDLISSAVTFLQDPSVASAPHDKKLSFLQSKNLTQEEIEIALARAGAGDESSSAVTQSPPQNAGYNQQPTYRPQPPPNQAYGYGGQWQATQPPPELPRRDWRDWFIMATVMGGVGYGLYFVTKRYITPLIAPPTPPQLQQDKESIDEQFSRAFALLDQLSTDTAALKSAEEARTERLDAALREVEDVVSELKSSSRRRDDETRRISEEVRGLKDSIPKAIDGAKEGNDRRLRELGTELKSLKVLLGNRLSASAGASASPSTTPPIPRTMSAGPGVSSGPAETRPAVNGAPSVSQPAPPTSTTAGLPASQPAAPAPAPTSSSPFSQLGKPAAIPAWQMAAANKSKHATVSSPSENTGSSASTENQPSAS